MKEVHVQVKSDHLQRMSRVRAPIDAVAELIWNALDADATDVKVVIKTNVMGGVQSISVKDNGHGIDYAEAEPAFENLGGSWKKDAYHSKTRRRHHGKAGQERFRTLSLETRVRCHTGYKKSGEKIFQYTINARAGDPGPFRIGNEAPAK